MSVEVKEHPVQAGDFEPKIIAFTCHWCAYAGADLAGSLEPCEQAARAMLVAITRVRRRSMRDSRSVRRGAGRNHRM